MLLDDYLIKYDKQIGELAKLFHTGKDELIHEIKELGNDKSEWEDNSDDAVWLERGFKITDKENSRDYPFICFKINLQIDWSEQENEEDIRHFDISLDVLTNYDTECYFVGEDFSAFDVYREGIKEYLNDVYAEKALSEDDTLFIKYWDECDTPDYSEIHEITIKELSAIANDDSFGKINKAKNEDFER